MKRYIMILSAALPAALMAQSSIDALQITQSDFKGTARFMSMGGAFTALGGDLSTLNQNPAGIGVYRSSEIGATMDINIQSSKTPNISGFIPNTDSQTKVYCNNFGYVGATNLTGSLKSFNWGVTFNRAASFDRVYRGYAPVLNTSLSNYIAYFSEGINVDDLYSSNWNTYNPYLDSDADWLSILAYNTYLINPSGTSGTGNSYTGLFKQKSEGDATFSVRERGYVDEYDISFGGNVENIVYWGLSIGITDLDYTRLTYYDESIGNADVPNSNYSGVTNGAFGYNLENIKNITGSGVNIKAGVIIKPVNEFRIGIAVHTPTWYSLTETYSGTNTYTYTPTDLEGTATGETKQGYEYTEPAYFQWKLNSPWKLMVGLAGVIGNKAIVSADYEFAGYNSMSGKTPYYYNEWGGGSSYESDPYINDGVKDYFRASNTFRVGAEYRVTPQFSVRAGYNITTSNIKQDTYDGFTLVNTAGTDPSYTFDKTTQNVSFGLGYKYQSWYIDAAYVYTHRESKYCAFTNFDGYLAPSMEVINNNSSIVLSTGFRF